MSKKAAKQLSTAELKAEILEYVRENEGCDVFAVKDELHYLDYVQGGVSMLTAALLDLLDTGEIDDESLGGRRFRVEPDPDKQHGRWL